LRPAGASAATEPAGGELAGLSDRELRVLRLIAAGKALREMADELDLSVKTIGTYRERLKSKLGVETARLLERKARELLGAEKGAA
jgi:two-component system response regulator NreC